MLNVKIVDLGTKTRWGVVSAVMCEDGERWYFMIDNFGAVAKMPAFVVEESLRVDKPRPRT